jgi:hypothetical protein
MVDELTLDAAGPHDRQSCPSPTSDDVKRYFHVLKDRQEGTLYLLKSKTRYLVVGVQDGIWLAHLYTGDSLWIANQQKPDDEPVEFNFANTDTTIPARFTCAESDALRALESCLEKPDAQPSRNWVSEYDESA